MSTPHINFAATQGLAKVVTNLDRQVGRNVRRSGPPSINEVIQLAETMRAIAGDELAPVLDRIWAAAAAIDAAEEQITGQPVTHDLLDLDAEELTARVVESCYDRAARDALAFQNTQHFRDGLARSAGAALRGAADRVVDAMRPDFDAHAKVIAAAARVGISEGSEATMLLETGTPGQIEAYRALPAAVAALEQMAGLRSQMAHMLGYGPTEPEVLAFIAKADSAEVLQSAVNRYADPTEVVQYNQEFVGSSLVQVQVQRLGGCWLALVNAGHTLRLNTADEASSLLDNAMGR